MSKCSNDARDRAMKMMNEVWHRKASKLIADASKELGAAFAGDGAELITESMMTVAIGYELQTKGFRQLSLDLYAIGKNFARLADQMDDQDDIAAHFSRAATIDELKKSTLN
jgi:hypothetical protein